jgi:hypothetical protein
MNDRAPSSERSVPRPPRGAGSSQVLPRHTREAPYRCSLPGLAGFDVSRCVGPNLHRRPTRLTRHGPASRGNSTPLKRIAGYRAPLVPRLARPCWSLGGEGGIRTRGTVARARHFQCRTFGHSVTSPAHHDPIEEANWRRGEDLNPRGTFWAPIRFRVGRLRPGSATPPHKIFNELRIVSPHAPSTHRAGKWSLRQVPRCEAALAWPPGPHPQASRRPHADDPDSSGCTARPWTGSASYQRSGASWGPHQPW